MYAQITKNLEEAFAVRQEVFIKEQGVSLDEEFDGLDLKCTHFVVRTNGLVVGTSRVRVLQRHWFEKVAVLKAYRGKGVGRALIEGMEDFSLGHSCRLLAQVDAIGFYSRLGWKKEGELVTKGNVLHQLMIKN